MGMTHLSVFLSATFVQGGLLLLFSSASFLEMNAAAFALLLSDTFPDPPLTPDALLLSAEFKLTSSLPIFTVMVTVSPAVTCWTAPVPLPAFLASELVAFFSLLAESSDWKNWILDCSVFATVVEVRGAGVGLVAAAAAAEAVVVNVGPGDACEVTGLGAKDVRVSLATEERAETGREGGGDGVEIVLEKLGGLLALSFCHVGPSLEEMSTLVLLVSRGGVGLETEVFVGKSLRGGQLVMGVSDLSKHKAF